MVKKIKVSTPRVVLTSKAEILVIKSNKCFYTIYNDIKNNKKREISIVEENLSLKK